MKFVIENLAATEEEVRSAFQLLNRHGVSVIIGGVLSSLGLEVLGVVGVLLLVHAKYEIDHLKLYLDALRQTAGFYFRRVSLSSLFRIRNKEDYPEFFIIPNYLLSAIF